MWSASSSTVTSTASRVSIRCLSRSSRRPGQATRMSTPALRACTWRCCETPPKTVVTVRPVASARGSITAAICVASSRVGASTRASGRPERREPPASRPARRATMREGEREGLPAARAAAAEHVTAGEAVGQRRLLDREGRVDARRREGGDETSGDAEFGEGRSHGEAFRRGIPLMRGDAGGDRAGRHVVAPTDAGGSPRDDIRVGWRGVDRCCRRTARWTRRSPVYRYEGREPVSGEDRPVLGGLHPPERAARGAAPDGARPRVSPTGARGERRVRPAARSRRA